MTSASESKDKFICCLCCQSGPITGTIHIPGRRGFVPGETIPFEGEILNKSDTQVSGWSAKFVKEVDYKAHGNGFLNTKTTSETIRYHHNNRGIQPGEEKNISCKMTVPPLPASELEYCDFIVINYYLILKVKPVNALNMDVKTKIIIGTIPIRSEWSQVAPPSVMVTPPEPLP